MSIKFFGKYRGQVIDNLDPEQIGRLLVSVPVAFLTRRDGPCLAFRSLETSRVSSRFLLAERTYGSSSSGLSGMERLFLGQACGGAGSGVERARGKPVVIESAAGTILVLGNVSDPMGGILLKNSLRRGPSISRIP